MAPGEGREFRVQTRPREVAAVKDRVQNPPQPPAEDKQGVRESGLRSTIYERRGVGNKKNLFEKRDSRGAGGHSNRVQIFECLMVYGQFLMLLPRNITAFPLALIFIFSFITHCITGSFKRERKKADPSVNRSNFNSWMFHIAWFSMRIISYVKAAPKTNISVAVHATWQFWHHLAWAGKPLFLSHNI